MRIHGQRSNPFFKAEVQTKVRTILTEKQKEISAQICAIRGKNSECPKVSLKVLKVRTLFYYNDVQTKPLQTKICSPSKSRL